MVPRLRAAVTRRPEPVVLGVVLLGAVLLRRGAPGGVFGLGLVNGSLLALDAAAVVLVYRSSRIINLAQISLGVLAATVFAAMVTYEPLLRWTRSLCGSSCLQSTPRWVDHLNYALSAVVAIGIAVGLSWLAYQVVVRPLESAPRLVGTVATIFLVSVFGVAAEKVPGWLSSRAQKEAEVGVGAPAPPFGLSLHLGGVTFSSAAILTVAVVAVGVPLLGLYLRRSATGVAIRASAEAPAAMAAVGIDVRRVTSRVWLLAGLLAGLVGVLSTMGSAPPPAGTSIDAPVLVRVLAAAVIARFVSLPLAAAAAVVAGVLDQTIGYAYGSVQPVDVVLFLVLAAVLLLQRAGPARLDLALAGAWRTAVEIRPTPQVLRALPTVRSWRRTATAAGAVVVLGAPWLLSPSQTTLASYALLATIVFLSLLILTGWAGQISLGQLAFAAVGAWVTAVTGLPALVAVPLAMLCGAAVAVAVGIPALKLRGLQLAIVTLVFNLAATTYLLSGRYLGSALPDKLRRPRGLGLDLDDERTFFYVVLVVLALVFAAVVGLRRSALARELIATRDNEAGAQAFGVSPVRARLAAFAVAGALAALAGSLMAYQQHAVIADTYTADQSVLFFLYAVIGGLGAPSAALVAGAYFSVVTVFGLPAAVTQLLTGVGGLLLLLLSRGGLAHVVYLLRDAWLRSIARRRRIAVPSLGETDGAAGDRTLAIAPKSRPGGGTVFVVPRYRVDGQYGIPAPTGAAPQGPPHG
jgi:branched-chain amino acid transport system permease protein